MDKRYSKIGYEWQKSKNGDNDWYLYSPSGMVVDYAESDYELIRRTRSLRKFQRQTKTPFPKLQRETGTAFRYW
jgi:hypothetical protein